MCDRKNMKICLPDNLSLLDSSYFKSHGIWVLEKDQRQMWIPYTHLDRNLSLAIATSTLTVSWRHSVAAPMVSCLPFSYIFSPPTPSLPNSPLRFLPVPSCAPSELPVCPSSQQNPELSLLPHLSQLHAHFSLLCSVFLLASAEKIQWPRWPVANPAIHIFLSFSLDNCSGLRKHLFPTPVCQNPGALC